VTTDHPSAGPATSELLLPPRARLFHIGPPKTGTTSLQAAASVSRDRLLAHGVRYPGQTQSHRSAVAAFLGRPLTWVAANASSAPAPAMSNWDALMDEVEAEQERRVWLGHEYAAGADDATAKRFADAIGPDIQVVITLRPYGAMLPSIWQEYNKAGNTGLFDDWLRGVLNRKRSKQMIERVHVRHDQGGLVRRWQRTVGADRVTVIVLDSGRPSALFETFEAMLGLPIGLLEAAELPPAASNRSLSVPELEFLRRTNVVLRAQGVPWTDYQRLLAEGGATRMLEKRRPTADEQRLLLPDWAAELADEDSARHVTEIEASGVRVVGDLATLATPAVRRAPSAPEHQYVETLAMDAAVEAVLGFASAALGRSWDFAPLVPQDLPIPARAVRDVTSRDLVSVVARRAAGAAKRRIGGRRESDRSR
jgi:hypothetical protein